MDKEKLIKWLEQQIEKSESVMKQTYGNDDAHSIAEYHVHRVKQSTYFHVLAYIESQQK